jgi:hypothetical protein
VRLRPDALRLFILKLVRASIEQVVAESDQRGQPVHTASGVRARHVQQASSVI